MATTNSKRRGAPSGNQNARVGKHGGVVMRLDVPTVDLICEVLALEGISEPTRGDIIEAARTELHMAFERRKGKVLRHGEKQSES